MENGPLTDEMAIAIADAIGDSNRLHKLGICLGFTWQKADMFRKMNRVDGEIDTKGTNRMLFEWKQNTRKIDQLPKLKDALAKAGFIEIADNLIGHLEPIADQTALQANAVYPNSTLIGVVVVVVFVVVAYIVGESPWNKNVHKPIKEPTGTGSYNSSYCMERPHIVIRQEWGAKGPKSRDTINTPVSFVVLFHTVGLTCDSFDNCSKEMRKIQEDHMDERGWDDIGYSFLVGDDGCVYEGRGWNTVGAYAKGYNNKSLGVAVMGNFNSKLPSKQALDGVKYIMDMAVTKKVLTEDYILIGHRQATRGREGPGDALYKEIQSWPHWKEGTFYPN